MGSVIPQCENSGFRRYPNRFQANRVVSVVPDGTGMVFQVLSETSTHASPARLDCITTIVVECPLADSGLLYTALERPDLWLML